jgi:phosphatidylglycerol lysyltransferase
VNLPDREQLLALLKRHGWNATSFQLLEPEFEYWFDGDACTAFVRAGNARVAAGAPIASGERVAEVTRTFVETYRRVAFFGVEERFLEATNLEAMKIGEQPWWDPRLWSERHRGHRSLKEQLRRARKKGVVVRRVASDDVPRAAIERLIARWMASRPMPPMAFLVELHPFLFAGERRYYLATTGQQLAGVLVAVPVYGRDGWFFEDLLRDPAAPNGTAEALVDFGMRDVAADGCSFVTLGLAPLAGNDRWLRLVRRLGSGLYNFEGLYAFKAKLRPDGWSPIYLAYPRGRHAAVALYEALAAFAQGRLIRFGFRALLRAPSTVLFLLALLLVPWIGLLAAADTARWFPSLSVQRAWIVFDALLAIGLLALAGRWRKWLARGLAFVITLDAIVTAVEAVLFNAPRDLPVIAVSLLAPLFVVTILIGGLRRRRKTQHGR